MVNQLTKIYNKMQKSTDIVTANDITRIAEGTNIKGDVVSSTDIRIDGSITGNVFSKGRIVVGETAKLSGNLLCTNLDFWGKMEGGIYVKETLSMRSSASLNGSLNINRLQVEMGSQINGSCRMITDADYNKVVNSIVKTAGIPAGNKEIPAVSNKANATPVAAKEEVAATK